MTRPAWKPALSANARLNDVAGLQLAPYQLEGVGRCFRANQLLAWPMGTGKAQPLDSLVLTPTGWRQIGDLGVGDAVVDPDGGHGVVRGIYPQGTQPVWAVRTKDGGMARCTPYHLWHVYTPGDRCQGAKGRVLELSEIVCHGLRGAEDARGWSNHCYFVPVLAEPAVFMADHPVVDGHLPVHPYLLGVLVGDGSMVSGSVLLSNPDEWITDRVRALLPSGVEMVRTKDARCPTFRFPSVKRRGPNKLVDAVRGLGLFGRRSYEKVIPDSYMVAAPATRLELLRGLMDTDGDAPRCGGSGATFNSSSHRLAMQVQELVRGLGGVASVTVRTDPKYTYRGEARTGRPAYRVHVRSPFNPFYLERKAERVTRPSLARAIVSVEPDGAAECVCISVSTKRGLYITDDYIVTHNTIATVAATMHLRTVAVVAPGFAHAQWRRELARCGIRKLYLLSGVKRLVATLVGLGPAGEVISEQEVRGMIPVGTAAARTWMLISHESVIGWGGMFNDGSELRAVAATFEAAPPARVDALVVDEIHGFGSPTSKRTAALVGMARFADRIIALSGTPDMGGVHRMWIPLALLGGGEWGSYYDFAFRYAGAMRDEKYGGLVIGKATNAEELSARVDPWFHIVPRDLVASYLPAHRRDRLIVPVPAKAAKAIGAQLAAAEKRLREHGGLESPQVWEAGEVTDALLAVAALKVETAASLIVELLDAGEKVVVWCWHRKTVHLIGDELVKRRRADYLKVTGELGDKLTDNAIDRWATDAKPRALLATMGKVGQGEDRLVAACYQLFVELPWLPQLVDQAESRLVRRSQTRPVYTRFLQAMMPFEESLCERLIGRAEDTDAVLGDESARRVGVLFGRGTPEEELLLGLTELFK